MAAATTAKQHQRDPSGGRRDEIDWLWGSQRWAPFRRACGDRGGGYDGQKMRGRRFPAKRDDDPAARGLFGAGSGGGANVFSPAPHRDWCRRAAPRFRAATGSTVPAPTTFGRAHGPPFVPRFAVMRWDYLAGVQFRVLAAKPTPRHLIHSQLRSWFR